MGDSKSLVDLDYYSLKSKFPEYNIVNLSLWARNPQYVLSVYENALEEIEIRNSIVIYNVTLRNLLNRKNEVYDDRFTSIMKEKIRNFPRKIFNKDYYFDYVQDNNGFIQIKGQNFGSLKDGIQFYDKLFSDYKPDFSVQTDILLKIKGLFNDKSNLFILAHFPHDQTIDSLYHSYPHYKEYKKSFDQNFETQLYFGHVQTLDNKKYWYNRDHLNIYGATTFSEIFTSRLLEIIEREE